MISEDGALTTTLVGILAERELPVTAVEATAFALGIHEDTGSLTYPSATQRDAEALGWCLRHGARQDLIADLPAHAARARPSASCCPRCSTGSRPSRRPGSRCSSAALAWPTHVDGISNLAHKIVDLTDCRALVLLVEMDERVFAVVRSRTPELDAAALARALGGGGHAQAASAIHRGSLERAPGRSSRRRLRATAAPLTAGRSCRRRPAASARTRRVAHAMVTCQRYGQSGILVVEDERLVGSVGPRGPRQGDRPRPLARSGQGDHELARRHLRAGHAARRGTAARRGLGRRPRRRARRTIASSAS